ncbi:MAG: hypothetical protein H3C64_14710, partial [Candidatus Kuenenia stuttgartiensis]|nr:hypothetical protein [Candidatus Kuenenia stuttgartiensis]
MISQKIALSFFPLSSSEFKFVVYRHLCVQGDKKVDFPTCTKRRLPINNDSNEYADYWVSLEKDKLEGFESFDCTAFTNIPLSIEFLFYLLKQSCQASQLQNYSQGQDTFRHYSIFFTLNEFPEGKQGVWLEPYFLKSEGKFGFLADFKFYKTELASFGKRVQQLSLSLDEYGRSNTNFYLDRYEKLKEFTQQFHSRLFPLRYQEEVIHVEKDLLLLSSDLLKFKTYVFARNSTDRSQFVGLKANGPLTSISTPVKVCFIYRKSDRQFSLDLYRALRGETFSSTFPGMGSMFRHQLSNENVSGGAVEDFTPEELNKILDSIQAGSKETPIVPVLVTPFNKDDYSDEASEQYYTAKYIFLRRHLPSQFVSLKRLQNREQLKWAISNIGLQLFAKMGGQPWMVSPETKKCLIIGLGQSHKKVDGKIEKYFAYSVLTDSSGLYKDIKILGQASDHDSYLAGFKEKLTAVFKQYYNDYENFVVHSTFDIRDDELDAVNDV